VSDIGEPDPWDDDLEDEGPWRVETDAEADRQLRKLARALREIERITENANRETARINDAKKSAVKTLTDQADICRARLVDYRRRLELNDRDLPKTYKLPQGTITRHAGSLSVSVLDEQEFADWALQNDPSLLSMSPSKTEIAKKAAPGVVKVLKSAASGSDTGASSHLVTEDGERVPGIELAVGPDKYDAKPA
jgi:phage host-nuclease inhibitor protein Gam